MAPKTLSLQDHFLNSVRRAKLPVTIFLVKGVKLQGVITWFDAFSLLLRRDGERSEMPPVAIVIPELAQCEDARARLPHHLIGAIPNHRNSVGKPIGVITAYHNGLSRIADIDHFQAGIVVRQVGVVS